MSNRSESDGSRAARMRALLIDALAPTELVIDDESAKHIHHAGARAGGETHYRMTIASKNFAGLSRIERTRMVNTLLADEFSSGLHALSLNLRAIDD